MRSKWHWLWLATALVIGTAVTSAAPAPYSVGDIFVATGPTSTGRIAAGSSGEVLTANGANTLPSWEPSAAGSSVPTGTLLMWPTTSAPTGYYICDGSAKNRTTDAALFAVIGETFGAGDGSTTFLIPDMRGRNTIGLKSTDADFDAMAETGGAKTVASAGTVAAPVFTGAALGTHLHGVGTYDNTAASAGTPAGTIAWPAGVPTVAWPVGVPTHSGTTATFTGNAVAAATTQATPDLVTSNVTGTGVSPVTTATGTVNITSQGTIAWPAGVPTTAWPAGVPTFSGTALANHDHAISGSSEAVSAGTPAGTNSAPTFTGSATSVVQPYIVVNFIIKK
jgi:microcystin-dependent protein